MPKEKSINPAQAQRKAEKAKAVKKGKAEAQSRRNEKLARRNPERLQSQLEDLKSIESSGGKLTSHEKTILEGLERDLKAVRKAREALGDAAPKLGSGRGGGAGSRGEFQGDRSGRVGGVLGKRRRGDEESSSDSDVPDDIKRIPMPRDTPPPFPKEVLDEWWKARRERMAREREGNGRGGAGTNANMTPLGANDRSAGFGEKSAPSPVEEARTVYESKPVIRDLRKEAVSFVPAAVRAKLDKGKGVGGLVEPEEADRLEKAGYMGKLQSGRDENAEREATTKSYQAEKALRGVMMEEVDDEDG